jgi:uncharacterized protein (TIGR02145 family)
MSKSFQIPVFLILFVAFFSVSCKKESYHPFVITQPATDIAGFSASLNGTVNTRGLPATVSFEYGTSPSYDNTIVAEDELTIDQDTNIVVSISGLSPNTTYHYRLRAENVDGISYGDDLTFKTLMVVTDIDGFKYESIEIGTQVWLTSNLKTSRYRNGNVIPLTASDYTWANTSSGAYCSYGNENANVSLYGALYNWYAVVDPRGLCPTGWHVPTNEDWTTLTAYLGGLEISGGKMKETGFDFWFEPNSGATNSSGFKAKGAGFRDYTGTYADFKMLAYIWSSSEYSSTHGIARKFFYDFPSVSFAGNFKNSGFSVRCIKD